MGGIVLGAFLLRLFYLLQIESIPFFEALVSDAQAYNAWADRIRTGGFLGTEPFYQAPAYPYFLALVKSSIGTGLFGVRVVQCLMGALSCGLIGLAGAGFFNRRAGLWSAGILAVYGPALFVDGLIQKTALAEFLGCLLLASLAWQQCRPGRLKPVAIGLVLALFALTRENALVLAPVIAAWLWLGHPSLRASQRIRNLALTLLGLAVLLGPVGLRNRLLGGGFSLTTVQLGPNFFVGNNPEATGRYRPLVPGHETPEFEQADATRMAEEALGRSLSPDEVSDYWLDRSWAYIRHQPGAWLKLMVHKWLMVWNAYEIPDTESYNVYAEWSWLLGTLGGLFHFGVLVPAAAMGVWLTRPCWRRLWLLYAMVLAMAGAVALFFVFGRYRYPLVPALVLLAGAGLVELLNAWRRSDRRRVLAGVGVALAAGVAVNWPINPERELDAMAWGNLGSALARQDRIEPAVVFFERAVEGAPSSAEMRYNLGLAYARTNRLGQAVEQFEAALALNPQLVEVNYQLASVLERLKRFDEALVHYGLALKRNPGDTDAANAIKRLGAPAAE
ncbi:MAG: tetratricopeptide repeat protein [Phycisphaerae bacterium]